MKEVLVIAITRLGDLIQTEPLLRSLKRRAKSTRVTLLVERSFVGMANRLEGADRVLAVDFNDILGSLDRSVPTLPLAQYIGLTAELRSLRFDEVWNVTHNRPAMVLTTLVGDDKVHGVALDRSGLQIVRNEWLTYFFATNLARPWCAFNLIDIYVNSASPATAFSERVPRLRDVSNMSRIFPSELRGANVLLHPGASQSDKQWPAERFVSTARWLLDRGAAVTLVGGGKEQSLESAFPAHRRLRSVIGKTNENDLIQVCQEADFLVSADSGPVHVAAACGLPVIAIEGGSAHGQETAPYGTNSLVLQPHLVNVLHRNADKTRASGSAMKISVENVLAAVSYMCGEDPDLTLPEGVTAYVTEKDKRLHTLHLRRVAGGPAVYDELVDQLRIYWGVALDALEQPDFQIATTPLSSAFLECAGVANKIASSQVTFEQLEHLAARLTASESNLTHLLGSAPHLSHVRAYLQIARSSVPGDHPESQAAALADLYSRLATAEEAAMLYPAQKSRVQTNLQIEEVQ